MKKLLFLALGIALEMSAQTDVYTGLPCISNVGTRRWSYDVVDSEKKHTVLQQFDNEMLWEERESVQKGGSAYYVMQMKLNYKVVPEMSWLYRQEGAKIYFYDEDRQGETLMMDFGLKEGDTFLRECGSYTLEAEVVAVYDTTITENYWDTPYTARAIKLQGKEPHTQYKDIWVEGIGSIYTGMYPVWKTQTADAYLLDYNTYGGYGLFELPLAPDVPQCIKKAKITYERIDLSLAELLEQGWPNSEQTHYEFVDDTLRVWGVRDYKADYEVCLIGGDHSLCFYELRSALQEDVWRLEKFEMKFDGFEPGEYTIYNDKGGIDTTLVCKGAEVPEVCDFEPILKDGRTWNYVIHDTYTMTDDYYSLQVGGDTIASDIPCKKILYIQGEKVQLHSLMYEKDGRVYSQTDEANGEFRSQFGEWMLLYDFNLKEGETFKWLGESYRVVETDTLNTYGHKRRRIHFCNEGWEYNKGAFTWIEGIGGKEGLEIPFMLPFSRYTFHLKSCYDGKDIIYSAEGEGIVNAYTPFVEEGKVWSMLYDNEEAADLYPSYEFYYFIEGDTLISGLNCKKFYVRNENNNNLTEYLMALYEANRKVLFFPKGSSESHVLYDFSIPAGSTSFVSDPIHPDRIIKIQNNEDRVIISDGFSRHCLLVNRFFNTEIEKSSGWWIEGVGSELGPIITWQFEAEGNAVSLLKCETNGKTVFNIENFKANITESLYAYRPFVEEGKVWMLGFYRNGADPTTEGPLKKEYHYLLGDTVLNGQACLSCLIREERRGGAQRTRNAGGAYEENGVVNILAKNTPYYPSQYLFYPFYTFLEDTNKEFALYDATVPNDGYISRFVIDKTYYQDTDTYKGWCIDVSPSKSKQDTITWYQGVGYMGFYNLPQGETGGKWKLMACAVDDEVLYYDASLMDWDSSAEAKKKKLDFTHVIKAQPRAPRRRAASADQDGLSGEYSETKVFVRLNALTGNYTATLTDASGQVVYRKTVLTDNVLALNTALTAYGPGSYVLILENDEEAFTATLNIEPNGIRSTPSPSLSRGAIYDLQGRKLMKAPMKGLYIQDGKKVVIK